MQQRDQGAGWTCYQGRRKNDDFILSVTLPIYLACAMVI